MSKDAIAPMGGTAGGAGLGAIIGSVVPGVGTLAGAAIGGAVGGLAGTAASGGFSAPKIPDMPDAPAPAPIADNPAMEMPDPGNTLKKKQKQATILRGMTSGADSTILSDAKLGG